VEVLAGGALASDHGVQKADAQPIDGGELDALRHGEQARILRGELWERAVRDGHSLADARRLQLLSLPEHSFVLLEVDFRALAKHPRQKLQDLGLVQRRRGIVVTYGDAIAGEKVREPHGSRRRL